MSAEAILIKRLAKALQEIAKLSEIRVNGDTKSHIYVLTEDQDITSHVTPEVKVGLDYAASIAKEALKGVIV